MAYTSSDCVLVNDPWKTVSRRAVHGFRRTEKPSNELGIGVDMYLIPVEIWDQYLSRDIPDLYIGVTHMDWWLPRACQKIGMYNQIDGLLTHESHPKISGEDHPKALHNLTAYNAWADRNGISKV
jgi:hypothetical protein